MPDRTVGTSDAKVNPTGQFPALPEPTLWQRQETHYKEKKDVT